MIVNSESEARKRFNDEFPYYPYSKQTFENQIKKSIDEINILKNKVESEIALIDDIVLDLKKSWNTDGGRKTTTDLYNLFENTKAIIKNMEGNLNEISGYDNAINSICNITSKTRIYPYQKPNQNPNQNMGYQNQNQNMEF